MKKHGTLMFLQMDNQAVHVPTWAFFMQDDLDVSLCTSGMHTSLESLTVTSSKPQQEG